VTPDDVAWLETREGAAAARHASDLLAAGAGELRTIDALRRDHPAERARAALALATGRRSASAKFLDADRLFFDRESAEQASSEHVARHTAARFGGQTRVADLGCGAGGDLLALAVHGRVVAVDRDPTRLAMARANARVRGLSDRTSFVEADLTAADTAGCSASWLDPARRDSGGRVLDPDRWSPSLTIAIEVARRFEGAGIKLAPGIERELLPSDGEREFISLGGALVAAILWLGTLARDPRTATVLTAGGVAHELRGDPDHAPRAIGAPQTLDAIGAPQTLDAIGAPQTLDAIGAPQTVAAIGEPGAYLYDPDPAVGRAELVRSLAAHLGAWQLDSRIAYLTADEAVATPFARRFRILAALPFAERRLLEELRSLDAARVEVMRRGSPIDPGELAKRLDARLHGSRILTVALARVGTGQLAIVCERERDAV
jgi:SAM-dependent methyltransferase